MRSLRVLVFIAVALAAVAALEEEEEEAIVEVEDLDDEVDVVDVEVLEEARSKSSGRTLKDWGDKFWKWMGYDYEYDEYDSYYYPTTGSQYGYGLPAVGYLAPSAGGHQSSYSSYAPVQVGGQQFGHPARDDDYQDEDWSLTDMMFDMAVTIVPIGLLLSALPVGLFTFAVRRRSFDGANMLMDSLEPHEVNRIVSLLKSDLTDRRCQQELFCELSRVGEHDTASYLQKTFYYVSTLTPDFLAGRFGFDNLFRTTRSGYCKALQCPSTSILEPPRIVHQPTDTNQITEVVADSEKEASEMSKE